MSPFQTDPEPQDQQGTDTYLAYANTRSKNHLNGSLVDRGANGGILGNDAKVIRRHSRGVDVRGIDNHEMSDLKIVDGASKVESDKGPIIIIMNQYAYHGINRTIHSSG